MPSHSAGALEPKAAAKETLETGEHHLSEGLRLCFFKNIYGGLLLSAGGLLSMILSHGMPMLTEGNPGMKRLLQGLTFPIGLVLVYLVGAELFTGYPKWLTMTALERKGRPMMYIRALVTSWLGNLIGALFFAWVFSYNTGALTEEPFRSGIVEMITTDVVDAKWHVIFLKAMACGFLVTVAMFLGSQNADGVSKALGLHLPFFISTASQFPHTVEYMYLGSLAMMLGAPLSIWGFLWKCMLPVTLGNSVGGSIFTGAYLWWVFLWRQDDEGGSSGGGNARGGTFDEQYERYHDGSN